MSTSFFILSKNKITNVAKTEEDDIISIANKTNYILPKNQINYYINNGLYESVLIEWSKQFCHKDKIMIDIGAHTGSYALSLSSYCKHVYAFEPQKMTYYALCGGVALSNARNITCINKGIGSLEQVGNMKLNIISSDGGMSSLHTNDSYPIIDTENIEITTLDNMNFSEISFIKIDVEENEKQVIEGAIKTIEMCNYPHVLFECNNRVAHSDLFSLLHKINYSVTLLNGFQNMYLAYVNK